MAKLAIFFGTGYEEIEALTVVDVCRRGGLDIDMVSITGEQAVTSSHGIQVTMDKLISDIDFSEYDMLVLPGGIPGTPNLEACDMLMAKLDEFYKAGKMIAAICAAPSIFAHRGYLKGRKACAFPSYEDELKELGVDYLADKAHRDGTVITGRGMGAAIDFSLLILEHFKGSEASEIMAKKVCFK